MTSPELKLPKLSENFRWRIETVRDEYDHTNYQHVKLSIEYHQPTRWLRRRRWRRLASYVCRLDQVETNAPALLAELTRRITAVKHAERLAGIYPAG